MKTAPAANRFATGKPVASVGVNHAREALQQLAEAVPKAPLYSQEDIARMIVREHSLSSRVSSNALAAVEKPKPNDINKTFLEGTIRSVESHNRREEVAQCWREREMLDKVTPDTRY
jgi:flagellar motor component MotA